MTRQLLALMVVLLMLLLVVPLALGYYQNEEAFSPYNLIQTHLVAGDLLVLRNWC